MKLKLTRDIMHRIKSGDILPPDTPSIMHGYKEPLRPVKDGFGYYGVVTYDKDEAKTQCHYCGYFFTNLGIHLHHMHGTKVAEYKQQFGLRKQKSLVATKTRAKYISSFEKLTESQRQQKYAALKLGWALKKAGETRNVGGVKSLEKRNEEGSCPDQLLDKIKQLADQLGRTPSQREFASHYGGYLNAVRLTFGTWTDALKVLKLSPAPSGKPPVYTQAAIIKMLQGFEKKHGRRPHISDVRDGLLPSQWTMTQYFGSWSKAVREAFK